MMCWENMTKCMAPTVLSSRLDKNSQVKLESGDLCVEGLVQGILGKKKKKKRKAGP